MDLSQLFAVDRRQDSTTIAMSPKDPATRFWLLGSSVPTSADLGQEREGTISFDLADLGTDRGVIAIFVKWSGPRGNSLSYPAILEVNQNGIELSKAFVCDSGQLAEIVEVVCAHIVYVLRVIARGEKGRLDEIFTTQPDVPGTSHVADGDLLCRFLAGRAELKDLQEAAQECMAEKTAREELDEIRKAIDGIEGRYASASLLDDVQKLMVIYRQAATSSQSKPPVAEETVTNPQSKPPAPVISPEDVEKAIAARLKPFRKGSLLARIFARRLRMALSGPPK